MRKSCSLVRLAIGQQKPGHVEIASKKVMKSVALHSCHVVIVIVMTTSCLCKLLSVFESMSSMDDFNPVSGIHLVNASSNVDIASISGLSVCARFDYKRLMHEKTVMLILETSSWRLLTLMAGYQVSFVNFGTTDQYGSSPGWIMQERDSGSFLMWSANRWHHFCLSYTAETSHIVLIKVWDWYQLMGLFMCSTKSCTSNTNIATHIV